MVHNGLNFINHSLNTQNKLFNIFIFIEVGTDKIQLFISNNLINMSVNTIYTLNNTIYKEEIQTT